MFINAKKLIGLSVETKSGVKLGKIQDFNIDISSHIVKSYSIKEGFLESKKLLISRIQVISISDEKMVVEDGVVKKEVENRQGIIIKPKAEPALSMNLSQDEVSNS